MISRTYFVKYRVFDRDDEDTLNFKGYTVIRLWFWQPVASIVRGLQKSRPGNTIMIDELVRV